MLHALNHTAIHTVQPARYCILMVLSKATMYTLLYGCNVYTRRLVITTMCLYTVNILAYITTLKVYSVLTISFKNIYKCLIVDRTHVRKLCVFVCMCVCVCVFVCVCARVCVYRQYMAFLQMLANSLALCMLNTRCMSYHIFVL